MDIEELAVSSIQRLLSRTDYLDAKGITSGDRGPSLDGEILVYKTPGREKKNLDGSVPIQVKGVRYQEAFPEDSVRYDVEITDLRNILRHGGALFFVVYLNKEAEKIYFRRLAPFDVNELLEEVNYSQKTKRIEFKPFPTDLNEVSSELISFLHDCRKQTLVTDGRNKPVNEIREDIDPKSLEYSISFTGIGYKERNPIEFLLNHDTYLYIENKKLNISFPIERIPKSDTVEEKRHRNTGIGNVVYFTNVILRYSQGKEETILGTCIKFVLDKQDGLFRLSFKARGNLDDRLVGEEFLYELFVKKDLVIDGMHIPFMFEDEEIKQEFDLDRLKSEVAFFKAIKKTLDYYGAKKSLKFDDISDNDMGSIKALMTASQKGSVKLKEKNIEGLQRLNINNLHLNLYLTKSDGSYVIQSFFKTSIPTHVNDGNKMTPTSQYAMLTIEDFVLSSNIDFRRIEKEIALFEDDCHIEQMRLMLLRMLCAYDITGDKDMLESASKIARIIRKSSRCEDCESIDLINIIQCNLRKRSIKKQERQALVQMIKDENDDPELLTAAYLLMNDQQKARLYYEKMNPEIRIVFNQYPINRFWESDILKNMHLRDYARYISNEETQMEEWNAW